MDNVSSKIEELRGIVYAQLKSLHLSYDEDATSIGLMALHKAILTFEEGKGAKLSTYATTCVYNALGCYIRKQKTNLALNTSSYDIQLQDGTAIVDLLMCPEDVAQEVESADTIYHINSVVEDTYMTITNVNARAVLRLWIDTNYTMTFREIALHNNCSISYVSNIIQAFRQALKRKLIAKNILED